MELAQALRLVAAGTAFGVMGAAGGLRLMRSMLFGVSPVDPLTLGAVILTIGLVAVLAAWAPARRATLVDPVRSLGQE